MWREAARFGIGNPNRVLAGRGAGLTIARAGRNRRSTQRREGRLGTGFGAAGLTLALTLSLAGLGSAPASAQYLYYGYGGGYWHPARHRPNKQADKRAAKELRKETKDPFGNIPKGPLQIFVSIDQQKLHLYSDGTHVADTSVATGVPSLPTPLGVFSVIQKQVFHRSNLYSDAPMPFMQRITWSGVALHEGESIGHRASHGCIRMPHDFAVRLYHLTRLGVPVFVAEKELKPVDFADPHLFVHRDRPPEQIAAAPAAAADPVGAAPTVGSAAAPTAPSSAPMPAVQTMTIGLRGSSDGDAVAPNTLADASATPPKTLADAASSDPVSNATKPGIEAAAPPQTPADAASGHAVADTPQKSAADGVATPAANAVADAPQKPAAEPAATPAPLANAPAAPAAAPAVPVPPVEPPALVKVTPPSKSPIAVFISRREKKIYVRQDFAPMFQAPVTFANPEKPVGTLAFTALDFTGADRTTLRWNVVVFPAEPPALKHKPERMLRYERYGRGRHYVEEREKPDATPPQTPAEALAGISIPQAAIDYISQLIVPGSTLVVSDHGLGDETGEGTNFVVVLR